MSRTHCDALWSVTSSDLSHIKKALDILLGDLAGASLRLEVFARMAGFRTYAGLRTRLESFADINGNPFPLRLGEKAVRDDAFFNSLDAALRRRLAEIEETGLMRLVIAALVQARHPILGDLGVPDDASLASLRETADRIFNISRQPREDSKHNQLKSSALVLTPSNTARAHGKAAYSVFRFSFSSSDDIPMDPTNSAFEMTSDPARLAQLLDGRVVYAYSTDDIFEIEAAVAATGRARPLDYVQLKNMTAHVIDANSEIDFQAMAEAFNCTPVGTDEDVTPEQQCMEWLIDMLLAVESYNELCEWSSTAAI